MTKQKYTVEITLNQSKHKHINLVIKTKLSTELEPKYSRTKVESRARERYARVLLTEGTLV